jgi:DNA (cytosine-5)-methyltransferase 1
MDIVEKLRDAAKEMNEMKYLSVCSGIEAATVAWHELGWKPLAFSEIEAFPRKVLSYHYPDVRLEGDFTVLKEQDWIKDADILVGGTPCQAFSVAGLRNSLDDDRGNLTLEFVRLADAVDDLRPDGDGTIIVWENVPGVLSVSDNAFGCFLGAIVGNDTPLVPTGGRWTNAGMVVGPRRSAVWRVLDAQYFGVAQRRRRVFVVASARDGFDPAEVLFEREGLRRDSPPSRKKGEEDPQIAGTITANGGGLNRPGGNANELDFCILTERRTGSGKDVFPSLMANVGTKFWSGNQEALSGDYHILEPVCVSDAQPNAPFNVGLAPALNSTHEQPFVVHGTQDPCVSDIAFAQDRNNGGENVLVQPQAMSVRRLTPRECERLQGFPDDYTAILGVADGPRYKALGNSMAVPVMKWIGKRVKMNLI